VPAALHSNLVFSCFEQKPWQLVDSTTGAILGDVAGTPIDPFPPGCFGMGRFADDRIWIAPETYFVTLDSDLTNPDGGAANTPVTDLLFSGGASTTHLYKISTVLGVPKMLEVDPATWTQTRSWTLLSNYGFPNIAADSARTVAFFSNSAAAGPVRKLDLGSGVESVFLASTFVGGLLMLPDDTLVVGWINGVKRYDLAGTLLNTYPANAYGGQGNLALGITSRNSIWIQGPATGAGRCHMYEVEIDTEALLVDFEMPEDGTSYNSPFAVVQTAVPPPEVGTIIVVKATDPVGNPTNFPIVASGGLAPADFTLADGESQQFDDVPAGAGYGIAETLVPEGWAAPVIAVSNASPANNISVADGEVVTVTITNTEDTPPTPPTPCVLWSLVGLDIAYQVLPGLQRGDPD